MHDAIGIEKLRVRVFKTNCLAQYIRLPGSLTELSPRMALNQNRRSSTGNLKPIPQTYMFLKKYETIPRP